MKPRIANRLAPACALAAALAGGCGGIGVAGGDDDGDDGDGGGCTMLFSVTPLQPVLGEELQLTGDIDYGVTVGFAEYRWTVRKAGAPLDIASADQQSIELTANQPGVYSVELAGSVGGEECTPDVGDINVLADGALSRSFRLRAVPGPDNPALPPPQELEVELWGGGDGEFDLGVLALQPGVEVTGVSRGPDGTPVGAYLRARRLEGTPVPPLYSETFAGDQGDYALRLVEDAHELLVIPDDPALPPYLHHSITPAEVADATQVAAGDVFAVSVRSGPDGDDPVAGARVSLLVGGLPSSIALTDESGQGILEISRDRPAPAGVSVSVVPPEASGLPQLELGFLASGLELPAGEGDIAVLYDASLTARSVAPAVRLADGSTPAAGSRVTWIARPMGEVGTVEIGGASGRATGAVRLTAEVDPSGIMAPALLPEAGYDAVVDPPAPSRAGQAPRANEVDLRPGTGDPAALRLAAPARLVGRVVAPDGEPMAGARVEASPASGPLLGAPLAGAAGTSGEDGRFTLLVAGGGEHEVTIDGAPGRQGRVRLIAAPAPGAEQDLETIALPPVLKATGILRGASGERLGGVHLQLFCIECGPQQRDAPVAETLTDLAGNFTLIAPDPGVSSP